MLKNDALDFIKVNLALCSIDICFSVRIIKRLILEISEILF